MTTDLSFTSNTIPTFVYEPFSFTISNPDPLTYTTFAVSNSPGIPTSYFDVNSNRAIFSISSNLMVPGINQQFVITASGPTLITTSSNTVTVGTGRFRNSNGNSLSGSNLTFYKNEPITPIQFRAPFTISTPTTVPTLPPGLGFTDVSGGAWYNLAGTPTVVVPQTNYLVIGQGTGANLGKIVTSSNLAVTVGNERLLINVSGSPIINEMTVGTDISSRVITAAFPPYSGGSKTFTYSWSGLPDGIVVKDNSGNTYSNSFPATDPSYTLVLSGAPTVAAANAFRLVGITSNTVNITASRTFPTPTLTSNIPFTFSFNPTVLFNPTVIAPSFYLNAPLDPSANYFSAETAFGSSPITQIFSPNLRTDLSINFVSAQGRGYLTGTPIDTSGTNFYTIRAINAGGLTRDLSQSITVARDAVTFTPRTDVCYNFIVTRPLSNSLSGYYPASIQFQASATSREPITFTTSDLTGTGLTLSNVSSNIVQLTGIPIVETALKNLRVTATAADTLSSNTQDVSFSILADTITFAPVTLSFIQNRAITPVQLSASSLSQRSIVSYSTPSVPAGLSLSTTGLLSGTPTSDTSGSFPVTASTGFASGTTTLSYSMTADAMIFVVNPTTYTYAPGANVSIGVSGIAYSGKTVSNYAFSNFTPSYGLSIQSTTGTISGTLSDSIPPSDLLPGDKTFSINANAGPLDASMAVTLTTVNPIVNRAFLFLLTPGTMNGVSLLYAEDSNTFTNWSNTLSFTFQQWMTDLSVKNTTVDSNTFLALDSGAGGTTTSAVYRSTDGVKFAATPIPFGNTTTFPRAYKAINMSNTNTWYIAGTLDGGVNTAAFYTSTDDGLTWGDGQAISIAPRQSVDVRNYFTAQGIAFGYSNGVFMIGGGSNAETLPDAPTMRRSSDMGERWDTVNGAFEVEVANFCMDASSVWVATGSSVYSSGNSYNGDFSNAAVTLKWSDDQGSNWTDASGTTSDFAGYEVAYASNTWLSTGMTRNGTGAIKSQLLCSTDGKVWSNADVFGAFTEFSNAQLPEVSLLGFDGTQWNVLVKLYDRATPKYNCALYSHDLSSSLASGWMLRDPAVEPFDGISNNIQLKSFGQHYVRTGTPTLSTFTFTTTPPGGPVITSPTQLSYIFYQYVPITPITVTATGNGQVYFFVLSSELPTGITFDPATGVFSGTSVQTGSRSVNLYAQDAVGVTQIVFTFTTIIPTVTRQQTGAGAWTSLVRQYTVVNAAQNSLNGRILPEPPLGEFLSPEPPDAVNASNCPKC